MGHFVGSLGKGVDGIPLSSSFADRLSNSLWSSFSMEIGSNETEFFIMNQ
jgi:hypothetical protein